MRKPGAQGRDSERGQAAAELLAALPAALLVAALGWQLVLVGHATWLAGNAARVGSRAAAVGADAEPAARSALPSYLRRGLEVRREHGGVHVRVRVPLFMLRSTTPLVIGASAAMESGG